MNDEIVKILKEILISKRKLSELKEEELLEQINIELNALCNEQNNYLNLSEKAKIVNLVYSSIRGYGPLDSIINDESITEVMINGYDSIFIEKEGRLFKIDSKFESNERLEDIIQKIVGEAGREVNQSSPIVDTRLKDGSRVNVVLPPISLCGPVVTIRRFSKTPMTMEKLISFGAITKEISQQLELLIRSKYNILVSGGTGSGKTTFLNALSDFIPKNERIITIEDSAELQIKGVSNLVSLETRNSNTANVGEITIRDLIKTSLRMRPERIIVGEVRGKEAVDMLQAMNTGHDGSLSTIHANSVDDVLSRLETMVLMAFDNLPLLAIRNQISSSVDLIIHLSRFRDGTRKIKTISEVMGMENGEIKLNNIYEFIEDENTTLEKVSGCLQKKGKLINTQKLINAGITNNTI